MRFDTRRNSRRGFGYNATSQFYHSYDNNDDDYVDFDGVGLDDETDYSYGVPTLTSSSSITADPFATSQQSGASVVAARTPSSASTPTTAAAAATTTSAAAATPTTAAAAATTTSAAAAASYASVEGMCRFYVLHGRCRYGSNCIYSHQLPEGMTLSEARKHLPCPFYAKGYCKYGDYCQLRHHDVVSTTSEQRYQKCVEIDETNNGISTTPSNKPDDSNDNENDGGGGGGVDDYSENFKKAASCLHSNPHTKDCGFQEPKKEEMEYCCGICLEDPRASGQGSKKFGLLSCCDHMFCFECLMEWRKQGSAEAVDRRNCPTCRKHSDYVIPSRVYVEGDAKHRAAAKYKKKLSIIPCKHFNGRLKSCIFGSDCFYAHKDPISGMDMKAMDASMEELQLERQARQLIREERRSHRMYFGEFRFPDDGPWDDDMEMIHSFLILLDLYSSSGESRAVLFDGDGDDDDDSDDGDE